MLLDVVIVKPYATTVSERLKGLEREGSIVRLHAGGWLLWGDGYPRSSDSRDTIRSTGMLRRIPAEAAANTAA